jgi:hypothetical protein
MSVVLTGQKGQNFVDRAVCRVHTYVQSLKLMMRMFFHRLNMVLDPQSLFGLLYTAVLIG